MPLQSGQAGIAPNIRELQNSGRPHRQAVAIALSNAARHPHRAYGGIIPHYDFGGSIAQTMTGIVPSMQPGYEGNALGVPSPYPADMGGGYQPISTQTAHPQQAEALQQYAALPEEKLRELQMQFAGTAQGQVIAKVLASRQNQPQAGIAPPQTTMAEGGGIEPESFGEAAKMAGHVGGATTGFLHSAVPGRTDLIHAAPPVGAFVIPADIVSGVGQGNSLAGGFMLQNVFGKPMRGTNRYGGLPAPPPRFTEPLQGPAAKRGGVLNARRGEDNQWGIDDGRQISPRDNPHEGMPTRILAAGGEFIVSPEGVRKIGGGDLTRGHDALDAWVISKRKAIAKEMLALKGPKR